MSFQLLDDIGSVLIKADSTDYESVMTELCCMVCEVRRSASESLTGRENIPKDLSEADYVSSVCHLNSDSFRGSSCT